MLCNTFESACYASLVAVAVKPSMELACASCTFILSCSRVPNAQFLCIVLSIVCLS